MSSSLQKVYTRADLERLSIALPEDKEQTITSIVNACKRIVLDANSKGEKFVTTMLYEKRPEIETPVIEKVKEAFVDSKISLEDLFGGYKNLKIDWTLTKSEKHTNAILADRKAAEEDDSDDSDEEDNDDDESPINLRIILSEPSTIYKAELICMIMVTSIMMSVMGSWLMVLSYMN